MFSKRATERCLENLINSAGKNVNEFGLNSFQTRSQQFLLCALSVVFRELSIFELNHPLKYLRNNLPFLFVVRVSYRAFLLSLLFLFGILRIARIMKYCKFAILYAIEPFNLSMFQLLRGLYTMLITIKNYAMLCPLQMLVSGQH